MFQFVFGLAVVIYGLYFLFTRNFNYWKNKKVRGPEPIPFFGNFYDSALRRRFMGNVIKDAYDQYPDEKVVGIYAMTKPILLIRDLDIVRQIMIKDFDLFADRGVEFSKEGLGSNLFHADGETWRVLRNRFTPLFTSGKLKNMMYLMTDRADFFLDHVKDLVSKQPEQEISKLVQKYTISTISACAFGIDIDITKNEGLLKAVSSFDKLIFEPSYANEVELLFPGILKKLNKSLLPKSITSFFYDLVNKIIVERNGAPIGRNDFMDLILDLKQQGEIKGSGRGNEKELHLDFNEHVIAAQAFIFYIAGYETSATTMTFMLYELARNEDVQNKVLAEIDEILKKYDGAITYDAINELKYMEKVFDETLRLYPVVDNLIRKVDRNYKVPGLDLIIDKGQTVMVSAMAIHRDAKYYPDPDKFDPERFSPEIAGDRHPCAYLPFGVGPRNCIGMRFAKVQSRICIMKLLSKFRVEATKNTPKQIILNPRRALSNPLDSVMPLKLVPRHCFTKK